MEMRSEKYRHGYAQAFEDVARRNLNEKLYGIRYRNTLTNPYEWESECYDGYRDGKKDAINGRPCLHTDPWADEVSAYDAAYNDLYGDGDPSNIMS